MHALGHQFLTGAAFAENKNGIFVEADLLDDFVNALHTLGDADQPAEAGPGAQLFAQELIFLLQLDGTSRPLQPRTQLLNAKRFRYIVHRAQASRSNSRIYGSVLG